MNWSVSVGFVTTGITYASGRVFVQNSLGGGNSVRAYDAGTGTLDWTTVVPNQIFTSAPTAANGDVYADGASTGGDFYAFRQSDGAVLWDNKLDGGADSSPAADGSEVLASFSCDQTPAYDPTSGEPKWEFDTGCVGGGGQTAVLADGDVFLRDRILNAATGQNIRPLATDVAPAVDSRNAYTESHGTLQAETVADGTVLWSETGDGGLDTPPIEVNGVIYEGSSSGELYAYAARTGTLLSSDDIGTPLNPNPFGTYQDSIWSLSEGDNLLAVPAGSTLTVFDQSGTAPNAPTGVSAMSGQGQAIVNWTVPADNGSTIEDFTITPSVGGVAETPFVVAAGGPSQPGVLSGADDSQAITGLTNGTTYTFTISADSAAGVSAPSNATGAVTPAAPNNNSRPLLPMSASATSPWVTSAPRRPSR